MTGKTTTRASIAEAIQFSVGLSRSDSAKMVDLFFDEIANALVAGEDVKLSGFGTFKLRHKNGRSGRNPRTKEEVPITPRTVVVFGASPQIKTVVDETIKGKRQSG